MCALSAKTAPMLISLGEPAGIGPDCVLRAFYARPERFDQIRIVAPAAWLQTRARDIGLSPHISETSTLEEDVSTKELTCWNPGIKTEPVQPGELDSKNAHAVIDCLRHAANACLQGRARALITGPIEKSVLKDAGFEFPGHTEFLAHLAGVDRVVMMLASDEIRVALLTTHMALKEVPSHLSLDSTLDCLRIIHTDMRQRFGIAQPRLALCGLNPHAGERGHFGREEIEVLAPAAERARTEGIRVTGPLPADTLFSPAMRKTFDVAVCCYHDQALIPIKALSFGNAVNVTLGLPFVRTSVDHGTALDLTGSDSVSFSSLVAAIKMAQHISHATK